MMSENTETTQTQQGQRGSPARTHAPRQQSRNRKVVLVGETFLSTKSQSLKRSSTGSLPRVSLESVDASTATELTRQRASLLSPQVERGSPVSSPRSSVSSLLDLSSSMSNLVMPPSSEQYILEELSKQIASSAARIHQLEGEAKKVSQLQEQLEALQKERSELANSLQDQQEVTKSLKQRVSMLHEQNSQLGKLLQSQKEGSGEVIAMRNTIMASLTQLKQLQEQVNTIPSLKKHISMLEQERDKLNSECRSSVVPPSQTADYSSLMEENAQLKQTNQQLVEEMKVVGDQLTTVSKSCDGLKTRMEAFEKAQAFQSPLREQVKRLEAEKDSLYHEIIDLKFHHRRSQDMDSAELSRQVATLQKANSQLRSKMEQMQLESRQQKEHLVLKLFEIEALNVKTQKYELEKQVLEMEQLQAHSEFHPILRSATASPDLPEKVSSSPDEVSLSPESKIQMLKLEQLKIHNTQSRSVMQAMLAERDELEKRVAELSAQVEEKGIVELQQTLQHTETKLGLAMNRNDQLEKELEAVLKSGNKMPSAAVEIERLQHQLERMKAECSSLAEGNRKLEKKYQHQKEVAQSMEMVKEEKRKAEKKYRESKEKLRCLAKELASSVTLLKDYQSQYSSLEDELKQVKSEVKTLRSKYATAVTELEVAKAENQMGGAAAAVTVLLDAASKTTTSASSSTIPSEEPQLQKWTEEQLKEQKEINEALSTEVEQLRTVVSRMSKSLSEVTSTKLQLEKRVGSEQDTKVLTSDISRLTSEMKEKDEELVAKQEEVLSLVSKIQRIEDQLSEDRKLEVELNHVREEIMALKTDKEMLRDQLKEREKEVAQMEKSDAQAKQEIIQLKCELKALDKQLDELKRDLDTTTASLQNELATKSSLESTIMEHEKTIRELENQVNELKRQTNEANVLYRESQMECTVLKEHLEVQNIEQSKLQHESGTADSLLQEKQHLEQKCLELEQSVHASKAAAADLEEALSLVKQDLQKAQDGQRIQRKELENMQSRNQTLSNEVEGYKATVKSLTRQIDQADAREMEYEALHQKMLGSLSDSSQLKVDNRELFTMLQEAVSELPSPSTIAGSQGLQEENLRLEQQVSVLSQWNDKQRQEIEMLESRLEELHNEKEGGEGEVAQLRQELKETEMEVNALRRQVKADLQEEMQVKIDTQSQMLSVFSEHNQRLQTQVEELQCQVRSLGGSLQREKAVSPPPFPGMTTTTNQGLKSRTLSEMTRENGILKERLVTVEAELKKMKRLSASVRRRGSTLTAITSIPIAPIHDDVQVR